jgi:2-polyprenyl-3-methyl-5-hydroxy-6-metoxy-1,4-benzoquinol methylase
MQLKENYSKQEDHIINLSLKERELRLSHIKNKDNEIYKKTIFPLQILDIFLELKNNWLTVGDYNGLEANYLLQRKQNVIASDISDAFLKEAKLEGLISDYSKQNAEKLSFGDNSFDYVMCKEAYHHFPRPTMAVYEMLRVCKKAVIVIAEPLDILSKMSLLIFIKNLLDKINPSLINALWKNRFSFEHVGNYVYKVSEREIEKLAMGIGLPLIAFKYVNIDAGVAYKILSRIGIIPQNSLTFIIFKESPSKDLLNAMRKKNFRLIKLPRVD